MGFRLHTAKKRCMSRVMYYLLARALITILQCVHTHSTCWESQAGPICRSHTHTNQVAQKATRGEVMEYSRIISRALFALREAYSRVFSISQKCRCSDAVVKIHIRARLKDETVSMGHQKNSI
jgi:hypothetical protein